MTRGTLFGGYTSGETGYAVQIEEKKGAPKARGGGNAERHRIWRNSVNVTNSRGPTTAPVAGQKRTTSNRLRVRGGQEGGRQEVTRRRVSGSGGGGGGPSKQGEVKARGGGATTGEGKASKAVNGTGRIRLRSSR